MALSFQPVTIDSYGDEHGTLVFRDGKLVAVVSRLSEMHDDLHGRWYIEAAFGDVPLSQPATFATLDELGAWLAKPD